MVLSCMDLGSIVVDYGHGLTVAYSPGEAARLAAIRRRPRQDKGVLHSVGPTDRIAAAIARADFEGGGYDARHIYTGGDNGKA